MINSRLFFRLKQASRQDAYDTFNAYVASEQGLDARGREMFADSGYEPVECQNQITADGREVVEMYGLRWALRPDVHAERLAMAFEAARRSRPAPTESETKSVVGTESLSAMTCPKCGDSLQYTTVCPKCAAGKLGYRHRYTCVCGGVDLVSKDRL